MAKSNAIIGKEAIISIIENSPFYQFKIHSSRPLTKDAHDVVKNAISCKTKEECIKQFDSWAETYSNNSNNPGHTFYIELFQWNTLGRNRSKNPKQWLPEIIPFRLEEAEPAEVSGTDETPSEALIQARIRAERLEWELEKLKAEQLEDDEDDDEEDEDNGSLFGVNLNSEFGQEFGSVLLGLAKQFTANIPGAPGAAANPLIQAFQAMKNLNPKTEQIIIRLGQMAKEKPEDLNAFLEQIYSGLFPPKTS